MSAKISPQIGFDTPPPRPPLTPYREPPEGGEPETESTQIERRIAARIEELVGPQRYKVWFRNSTRLTYTGDFLEVGVPNSFIGGWIEGHFVGAIAQAANEILKSEPRIGFSIDPSLFRQLRPRQLDSQASFIERSSDQAARGRRGRSAPALPELLRMRGRLEDFVVGAGNRLAHSIALSIIENPHADASPVFFHGGCGLGKTHLMQAMANGLLERRPRARCLYVTGEEFTNQFLTALQERRTPAFRRRFRDLDLLLLDDVHFIKNKKATQEEFLHTYNSILGAGMRVVFASDAHPKLIGDLSPSLVSRMLSGMVVRIDAPDLETRCEILRRRARNARQAVPEGAIAYIAERIQSNIRELEGCLVKLLACAAMMKTPITPALAREVLEEHVVQTGKILNISDIESSAATFFGIMPSDLHTSRKSRTIALARNVAMHLARKHTELSFPEIGRMMGHKNHTTVLSACRRMTAILAEDGEVKWQTATGIQSSKLKVVIERLEAQMRR